MQNLRDQLLKAKLIDKKKKRAADQEARSERRKKGAAAIAEEEAARRAEHERKQEEQRESDRKRERQREAARREREERLALKALVMSQAIRSGRNGPQRFHFVTRSGRIPFLEVTRELALDLERGKVAIVEVPEEEDRYEVVPVELAKRLGSEAPELVRFSNR